MAEQVQEAPEVDTQLVIGPGQADNVEFGMDLRAMRRANGQRTKEVSEAVGVTEGYIRMIESGVRTPTIDRLAAMLDSYGTDYTVGTWLIDGVVVKLIYTSVEGTRTALSLSSRVQQRVSDSPPTTRPEAAGAFDILRGPFPASQVGKLPRITCGDCRQQRSKVCDRHQKGRCQACGQWITSAHIHLDYVGHAAATARLLDADPAWNWEPAYRDVDKGVLTTACASGNPEVVRLVIDNSPPLIEQHDGWSGMWVKLTVCGVTRLGYATEDRGDMNANKILIGDGIRNAGMRFGIALDLWSKEDLQGDGAAQSHDSESKRDEPAAPTDVGAAVDRVFEQQSPASGRDWIVELKAIDDIQQLLSLSKACSDAGEFEGRVRMEFLRRRAQLSGNTVPAD